MIKKRLINENAALRTKSERLVLRVAALERALRRSASRVAISEAPVPGEKGASILREADFLVPRQGGV